MFKLLLEETPIVVLGVNAEGANAATEPAVRAATEKMNFILLLYFDS